MSLLVEDSVCRHCHQAIYRERFRETWSVWRTVYVNSCDTRQCPRPELAAVVNDGHEPIGDER